MLRHRVRSGFTVIELMIGVVIVGVLAALAIPSFTGYVYRGRVSEAISFLNEIKTRQEAYRSRHGRYAAVSGEDAWDSHTPDSPPSGNRVPWESTEAWEELGVRAPTGVRFRYATVAGPPWSNPPLGTNLRNDDFWFAAQALGDLNGDGETFEIEVYSNSRKVYNSAAGQGGWE